VRSTERPDSKEGTGLMEFVELGDRWLHFFMGVLWIGLLYFFNWVNSAFAPTMDAETKKKVVPELMPRALYWFRLAAGWTWITGVILMFVVYYHGPYLVEGQQQVTASTWLPAFLGLFVGFVVYDLLFKALAKQHAVAVIIWGLIAIGFGAYCREVQGFSMRATFIHVAALFGTAMAANVWMRIWPAQRRIITAIKNGEAPEAADPALAGLRSKHNTYMSLPLLLFMVAVHQDSLLRFNEGAQPYFAIAGVLLIGFAFTYLIYAKAKTVPGF
jgi:uncharacterized membrane protein